MEGIDKMTESFGDCLMKVERAPGREFPWRARLMIDGKKGRRPVAQGKGGTITEAVSDLYLKVNKK